MRKSIYNKVICSNQKCNINYCCSLFYIILIKQVFFCDAKKKIQKRREQ